MNTYFQQSLTEVQSQEFASDFKATVRFFFRLIKIVILLLTAIFTLGRKVYCKVSKQNTEVNLIDSPIGEPVAGLPLTESSLTESTLNSNPTEDNLQQAQGEESTDKVDNPIGRCKELKLMKATELRKLCTDYSINYQNKQQAFTAILDFESPSDGIPF